MKQNKDRGNNPFPLNVKEDKKMKKSQIRVFEELLKDKDFKGGVKNNINKLPEPKDEYSSAISI